MPTPPIQTWDKLLRGWLGRVRRPNPREWQTVQEVRRLAEPLPGVSQETLTRRVAELRDRAQGGARFPLSDLLAPTFALVCEAVRRTLAMNFYDVQLLAGRALAEGNIVEMQTGEGKTLVALLPAILHALAGRGVHIMTVNDYLARRDAEGLAPVYECLGLSVGLVGSNSSLAEKRLAYRCDVTYGPGYQFGFDYLQDQLLLGQPQRQSLGTRLGRSLLGVDDHAQLLQRGLTCAIVDEADSVLLDEATTPLILAEPGTADSPAVVRQAWETAKLLVAGTDFVLEPAGRQVWLTDRGVARASAGLPAAQRGELARPWNQYVIQALTARHCLSRDVQYVVRDGSVQLVDTCTGRILADRTWQEGLHQALEAKEGLSMSSPRRAIARISRQRLAGLYTHLCGMTGTAVGSQREFWHVYGLPVVTIPTHRTCRRITAATRFFASAAAKFDAAADSVQELRAAGRPVLVGVRTIADSELLADRLAFRSVPFQLLNGKQDADEAAIVGRAGQRGSITLATNMAGRGTDIRLGPGVAQQGGLHVISLEPHESPRVDRQLAGRAARQGDPGSSQMFVSAEDHLLTTHAPALAERIVAAAQTASETARDFGRPIRKVQQRAERLAADQRLVLLTHDAWRSDLTEALLG